MKNFICVSLCLFLFACSSGGSKINYFGLMNKTFSRTPVLDIYEENKDFDLVSEETKETEASSNYYDEEIEKNDKIPEISNDPYAIQVFNLKTGFKVDTIAKYYGNDTLLLQIPSKILAKSRNNNQPYTVTIGSSKHQFVFASDSTIESTSLSHNINLDTDLPKLLHDLNLRDSLYEIDNQINDLQGQIAKINEEISLNQKGGLETDTDNSSIEGEDTSLIKGSKKSNNKSQDKVILIVKEKRDQIRSFENDIQNLNKKRSEISKVLNDQEKKKMKQIEDNNKHNREYNLVDYYLKNSSASKFDINDNPDIYLTEEHIKLLKNFTANINPNKKYIIIINVTGSPLSKWLEDGIRTERTRYTHYVYNYFMGNFKNIRVEKRYVSKVPEDQIFILLAEYEGDIPLNVYNAPKGNISEWLDNYQELEKELREKNAKDRSVF